MQKLSFDFPIGSMLCHTEKLSPSQYWSEHTDDHLLFQHEHPVVEIHCLTAGECTMMCGRTSYHLQSGQLFLVPPKLYHHISMASQDLCEVIWQFSIRAPQSAKAQNELRLFRAFYTTEPILLDAQNCSWQMTLEQIRSISASERDDFLLQEKLRALSALFLLELYQSIRHDTVRVPEKKQVEQPSVCCMIDNFFGITAGKDCTSENLAKRLHVSTRQLNRIIHKYYGCTFREKLLDIRLENATTLLLSTEKSVAEIAQLTGYQSSAAFCAFIKSAVGKTPMQIRGSK